MLLVLLAFSTLYGLQSAQYLLWVVPVGVLRPGRAVAVHAAAASLALVGFYLFLAPGVVWPDPLAGGALALAGRLWVLGAALTLATVAVWLARALVAAKTSLHPAGPRV